MKGIGIFLLIRYYFLVGTIFLLDQRPLFISIRVAGHAILTQRILPAK